MSIGIGELKSQVLATVQTKPEKEKISNAAKLVHYENQINSIIDNFEKIVQLKTEKYTEAETSALKNLYKAIFDYKYKKSQEETGENQFAEAGIRAAAGKGEANSSLMEFDTWIDDLIRLGKKSDNEDIRFYSQTSENISESDFSIKVDGNSDSDLMLQVLSVATDSELSLEPGYGFKFDIVVEDGDKLLMRFLIVGEADSEGIIDSSNIDAELCFKGADRDSDITEDAQACSEAEICASNFLDLLQQKVNDGVIDPYDLNNVSIEIKRKDTNF